jgi:hypothetical protein
LVGALGCQPMTGYAKLPTWDTAALRLAHLYKDTVGTAPEPLSSPGT